MGIEAKKPGYPLEKGQMWKLEHCYLHVVDVGKRFAHYKILRQPNQRAVSTRLIGIGELVAYLAHTEAEVAN